MWEVGVGGGQVGRWGGWEEVGGGSGREGFGSVWRGPEFFGSVRYGSGRFDTILGESIVETAMISHSLTHSLTLTIYE